MSYLLDTDTFSAIVKQRSAYAADRLQRVASGGLAVSIVTLGEVRFGIALKPPKADVLRRIEALAGVVRVLPLGIEVVPHYARLRTFLQRQGTPIGPNDMWLAAQALAADLTLVTGNEREFARVPTLRAENWMR